MIPETHLEAFRIVFAAAEEPGIDWAVTGSLGFALQGMPVSVHDIDLQTDEKGAYRLGARLAGYVVTPVGWRESAIARSFFGKFLVAGIEVEIIGGMQKRLPDGSWDLPVDIRDHRRFVDVEGLRVPVLDLAYEASAYYLLGRHEKAALIDQFLRDHPTSMRG